jgi:Holliday junction resolvase RusA-like endonuclease
VTALYQGRIPGDALMVNNMYINVPNRGRVLSSKARAWKAAAMKSLRLYLPRHVPIQPDARLHLELAFYGRWQTKQGQPLKKDVDGGIKAVQDALCEVLGIDDRQIYQLSVSKQHVPQAAAHILVTLTEVQK